MGMPSAGSNLPPYPVQFGPDDSHETVVVKNTFLDTKFALAEPDLLRTSSAPARAVSSDDNDSDEDGIGSGGIFQSGGDNHHDQLRSSSEWAHVARSEQEAEIPTDEAIIKVGHNQADSAPAELPLERLRTRDGVEEGTICDWSPRHSASVGAQSMPRNSASSGAPIVPGTGMHSGPADQLRAPWCLPDCMRAGLARVPVVQALFGVQAAQPHPAVSFLAVQTPAACTATHDMAMVVRAPAPVAPSAQVTAPFPKACVANTEMAQQVPSERIATRPLAAPAAPAAPAAQLQTVIERDTSFTWTVDRKKLSGTDKQVVSPDFKRGGLLFKMILKPEFNNFKQSKGRCYVQLKCESDTSKSKPSQLHFTFAVKGAPVNDDRPWFKKGPFMHDFSTSTTSNQIGEDVFDLCNVQSHTLYVCVDFRQQKPWGVV